MIKKLITTLILMATGFALGIIYREALASSDVNGGAGPTNQIYRDAAKRIVASVNSQEEEEPKQEPKDQKTKEDGK